MIDVVLNGDVQTVASDTVLGALIDTLMPGRAGVAAARNGAVVPRSQWDDTTLEPGDQVELLNAAQGG